MDLQNLLWVVLAFALCSLVYDIVRLVIDGDRYSREFRYRLQRVCSVVFFLSIGMALSVSGFLYIPFVAVAAIAIWAKLYFR